MEPETFVEGGYPVEPFTEVIPGLFQASAAHSPAEMLTMFDVLIDVGGRDRWEGDPDTRYSFHPLDDVPFIVDPEMIHTVGERIASLVQEGKHVAVNCLSGVNRSGLLVGRALVELGYTPEVAIEAVRSARGPMALSNQHFDSLPAGRLHHSRPGSTPAVVTADLIPLDISRSGRPPGSEALPAADRWP